MTLCVALVVSALLAATSSSQSEEPAPRAPATVPDAVAADREALTAHASERPVRTAAALNLLVSDPGFLAVQVRTSENDEVVRAVLEAMRIRAAATAGSDDLVAAVLERGARAGNGIGVNARETLKTLDRAAPDLVRPRLLAALDGEDAAQATAAIDVLALSGDLVVVVPLLGVLERSGGEGALATATSSALTELLGRRLGPDHAAWMAFWKECTGKTRVRILRDVLEQERAERAEALDKKDREIVRLKREADAADSARLVANLQHEIPGVRKFSAELLARGFDEIDLQPVRPLVLARLESATEPPGVCVAFLALLRRLDERAGRSGPDARRDAIVARALAAEETEVLLAALEVAVAFPVKQVRDAALDALQRVGSSDRPEAIRIALVEAAAQSKLNLASALDALRAILAADESVDVRVAAVTTLGSLKVADSGPDLERALANDPDWRVRRRAAGALRTVAGIAALEALLLAMEDPRPEVRSEVVLAVAQTRDPAGVAPLLERLEKEDALAVRAVVARALGMLRAPEAIPPLVELVVVAPTAPENGGGVEPTLEGVRAAAREALEAIAGEDAARWQEIAVGVGDGARDLRAHALHRRFALLDTPETEAAARTLARLDACRALDAIGAHESVKELVLAAGEPEEGASTAPYAELTALLGRARLGEQDPAGAERELVRALAFDGVPSPLRFRWSLDLAEARILGGDEAGARASLPTGEPPTGASAADIERRATLEARLGGGEGAVAPAGKPAG